MNVMNIMVITEDCDLVFRKPLVTFREKFSGIIMTRGELLGLMAESVVRIWG